MVRTRTPYSIQAAAMSRTRRATFTVTGLAFEPAALGPATIAVHDDGDMRRHPFGVDRSDLHHLGFLLPAQFINRGHVLVRYVLESRFRAMRRSSWDASFSRTSSRRVVVHVAPNVANGHLGVLGPLADNSHEVTAAVFAQLRNWQVDHIAVIRRSYSKVRCNQGPLDVRQRSLVPGLHDEETSLWRRDSRRFA